MSLLLAPCGCPFGGCFYMYVISRPTACCINQLKQDNCIKLDTVSLACSYAWVVHYRRVLVTNRKLSRQQPPSATHLSAVSLMMQAMHLQPLIAC